MSIFSSGLHDSTHIFSTVCFRAKRNTALKPQTKEKMSKLQRFRNKRSQCQLLHRWLTTVHKRSRVILSAIKILKEKPTAWEWDHDEERQLSPDDSYEVARQEVGAQEVEGRDQVDFWGRIQHRTPHRATQHAWRKCCRPAPRARHHWNRWRSLPATAALWTAVY